MWIYWFSDQRETAQTVEKKNIIVPKNSIHLKFTVQN